MLSASNSTKFRGLIFIQLVVIADPQLTDRTSYKFASSDGLLLWFLRTLCDIYLARCQCVETENISLPSTGDAH